MSVRPPKPANTSWLSPYLTVRDADKAIAFYSRAFEFEKRMAIPGPDGRTMHAEMSWHDIVIMMGPEGENNPSKAPATLGVRSPVGLYLYCDEVDALYERALAAGAKSESAPENKFYGDRTCGVVDPDGHLWYFATNFADFDPANVPH
jgi:PhnB protein